MSSQEYTSNVPEDPNDPDDDFTGVHTGLIIGIDEEEVVTNAMQMMALARRMENDYGEDCPPEWRLGPNELRTLEEWEAEHGPVVNRNDLVDDEDMGDDEEYSSGDGDLGAESAKVEVVNQPEISPAADVPVTGVTSLDENELSDPLPATKISSVGRTQKAVGLAYAAELKRRVAGEVSALPSGFLTLTKRFPSLFYPGRLVLLAARPGMGKTALANQIAENVAQKELSLFISLEMSPEELIERSISNRTGLTIGQLQTPDVSPADVATVDLSVEKFILSLNYEDRLFDLAKIESAIRTHAGDGGKFVVLDYLQLVNPSKTTANRAYDVGTISTRLKQLAQELRICILAISQLNRSVELRVDKRPMLSDLRESGSLEQDADAVLMLHRDEYYNPDSPAKGQAELICRKNRYGATGTVDLAFVANRVRFADLAQDMPAAAFAPAPPPKKSPSRQELL